MKKSVKGFTLVELIVVMIILAILAALIVPSMTGYIDKAKGNAVLLEAKGVYTAAQTAMTEYYAFHPNYPTKFNLKGTSGKHYGRVTNYMFSRAQNSSNEKKLREDYPVDAAIAYQVLDYLDSRDKATATYKFAKESQNPLNKPASDYEGKEEPAINVCYDDKGKIAFVEFSKDGYIARVEAGSAEVKKGGKMSNEPN